MKHFNKLLAVVFLTFSGLVYGQTDPDGFVEAQDKEWLVNIEKAYELSKSTNKPILANFTGSDWCGWCKRLRKEVFSQPEFKSWAEKNVVLLELDYPRYTKLPEQQAKQNAGLQQAFKVTGFPTIWMFDLNKPDSNEQNQQQKFELRAYGKTGYLRGGPTNYTKELAKMVARKAGE